MNLTDDDLVARVKQLLDDADPSDQFAFRGAQFDAGLAWVHFPVGREASASNAGSRSS